MTDGAAEVARVPSWIPTMFRAAAIQNWLVSVPVVVSPEKSARMVGARAPKPGFPTRAWAGMAVMFGLMFLEVGADPLGKRALVRYAWLEKLVSALAVTVGYRSGEATKRSLALLTFTDWLPILPFVVAERRLARIADERLGRSS